MSDEDDQTPDTDAPDDSPEPKDEPFDPARAQEKIRRQNSENANLRKRLKEAEAAQKRLDELENAGKSEQERLAETNKGLETRATQAERDAARLRIALRKGLTEAQAKRLVGDTEDDLEADADELLASFKPSDDESAQGGGRPKERLRPGAVPNAEPDKDVSDVLAKVKRGF